LLEARLSPSPANGYVGALIEVLKYPTAALPDRRARKGEPTDATKHLLGKLRERFPGARELQGGSLEDALDWVTKTYPEVDLARPPKRPAPLVEVAASLPLPR
jgi:hypothetical protein